MRARHCYIKQQKHNLITYSEHSNFFDHSDQANTLKKVLEGCARRTAQNLYCLNNTDQITCKVVLGSLRRLVYFDPRMRSYAGLPYDAEPHS